MLFIDKIVSPTLQSVRASVFARLFPTSAHDPNGVLQALSNELQSTDKIANVITYLKLVK